MIVEKNRGHHDPLHHSHSSKLLEIFSHLGGEDFYTNLTEGSKQLQRFLFVDTLVEVGRHGGDVVAQPGVAADVEGGQVL